VVQKLNANGEKLPKTTIHLNIKAHRNQILHQVIIDTGEIIKIKEGIAGIALITEGIVAEANASQVVARVTRKKKKP
jgi:hypothetical protein